MSESDSSPTGSDAVDQAVFQEVVERVVDDLCRILGEPHVDPHDRAFARIYVSAVLKGYHPDGNGEMSPHYSDERWVQKGASLGQIAGEGLSDALGGMEERAWMNEARKKSRHWSNWEPAMHLEPDEPDEATLKSQANAVDFHPAPYTQTDREELLNFLAEARAAIDDENST